MCIWCCIKAARAKSRAMLIEGTADIGVATEALQDVSGARVVSLLHVASRCRRAGGSCQLQSVTPLTLKALSEWPIITYSEGFTGRSKIDKAFAAAGIAPDIVLSALDADVIKAYVELGLGVGIVASMAVDAQHDHRLRLISAQHLFDPNISRIALRKATYLRRFAYRFVELCSADLPESTVRAGVEEAARQI